MFTESKAQKVSAFPFNASLTWLCFLIAAILCLPGTTRAQEQFTPAELDTLVSTIALYPDPLLVQVLAASVHGDEIPGASDWANQHKNLKGQELAERIKLEDLPYDESVQALIPFPTVLATMARYQVWTDQLGNAVASQKEAVMDAVQRMRNAAYQHGHLQSNEQVKIIKEKTIIIEPVQKEYIYVPVYNPHVVYYTYSSGYSGLRYRSGVWIGSYYDPWGWNSSRFEWDTHLIYVHDYRWYHNRPRPRHPPHRYAPPPPRTDRHAPPPPRGDRYAVPPSKPAKAPMNHRNAPVSHSYAPQPQHTYTPSSVPVSRTANVKNNSWQEDYHNQSRGQTYGNVTATRSSDRNSDRNSSNRNNSNGSSRGGFGRSMRK